MEQGKIKYLEELDENAIFKYFEHLSEESLTIICKNSAKLDDSFKKYKDNKFKNSICIQTFIYVCIIILYFLVYFNSETHETLIYNFRFITITMGCSCILYNAFIRLNLKTKYDIKSQ